MDPQQSHGYIQDEYNDLNHLPLWQSSGGQQYTSGQLQQTPDLPQYATTQSYDHFSTLAQPSYPQIPYSNSPYASQIQYQSTRPSDYGSTPYLDPSLQNSRGGYGSLSNSFSFDPVLQDPARTISPFALEYGLGNPSTVSRPDTTLNYQTQRSMNASPHSFNQMPQEQTPLYFNNQHNGNLQSNTANTVIYPALPDSSHNQQKQVSGQAENNIIPAVQRVRQIQPSPVPQINSLRITNEDLYNAKNLSSRPRFDHAPFVVWEDKPIEVQLGPKNALPDFKERKSVNGNPPIPGFDFSRTHPYSKTAIKKRGRPRKDSNAPVSKYKGTANKSKLLVGKTNYSRENGSLGDPKSPSTPTESSSPEDESDFDDESDYEEEPMVDISTVRGVDRPVDRSKLARWEAIGIVWKAPNSNPSADVIKDAIEKYGTFVSVIRADLKSNSTKSEEAAARPAEVKRLKEERDVLLESLYQTIDAANAEGFPAIVENLGGHHKLVLGLTTTLIECIKAGDYDGKLPKAVFVLLAKFKTLTDELLKKLKFDSIQKRWNKKGTTEIKGYISTILANTTDAKERASKAKTDEEKKPQDQAEQAKRRQNVPATSAAPNPAKRPHDGDGTNGKPVKKFASDVAGTPTSTSKTTLVKKPTSNLLGIATKPAPKPAPKPVAKKAEPPPPTESKLGALLASIAKAPEPPKAPAAPVRPPETPEQKARRERKESRRHLRVKFKDDNELTEIRYFKHEQAEDEGRQDEMLKDAHDDRLEGMMHKKRVLETVDDEDDDYQPPDVEIPYTEPPEINFKSLAKLTRFGPSYATRGGDLAVATAEQKKQRSREESELMVVYTDPNDIPPSPKEPAQDVEDYQPEPHLKEPTEPWLLQRVQEIHQYGPESASQIFLGRREEQMFREIRENRASRGVVDSLAKANASSTQSASVATLLQQLKDSHTPQSIPGNSKMDPNQYASLLAAVNYLKGKPFPPTEPPEWMNEMQKNEWWEGYYRDNPDKKRELDERIQAQVVASQFLFQQQAQAQQVQQAQQYQPAPPSMLTQFQQSMQAAAPQMSFPQAPPQGYAANQPADVAAQIQAYLAAYQQQLQQNGATPTANASQASQPFDYNAWVQQAAAASAQPQNQYQNYGQSTQSQSNQNNNAQTYSSENRWDGNNRNDWEGEQQHTGGRNKEAKKKGGYEGKNPTDNLFDENGEYKGKKKPCKFWREGKCAKGAKCTFLHE